MIKSLIKKLAKSILLVFMNLKSEWGNLGLIIIPILLAIPYTNKIITSNLFFICAIIVAVVVCWGQSNLNKQSLKEATKKKNSLEHERDILKNTLESVPEIVLKGIYNQLEFNYTDRITIYRYTDDKFIPVGRYSKNMELRKAGRSEYPKDKGFISLAWGNGGHLVEDLPDYDKEPNVYRERVYKDSNMGKGIIKNLSMKSRSYYCKNLDNAHSTPVGVIVFESLQPKLPKTKAEMDDVITSELGKVLVETFETNKPAGRG